MNRLVGNMPNAQAQALEHYAENIVTGAKQDVPVRTGALRDSIGIKNSGKNFIEIGADVPYAGFVEYGCFTDKNALILTQRGYVPFQHLNEGELAMTHLGRWRRIEKKHTYELFEFLPRLTLKTKRGSQITVTEDHCFLTPDGFVKVTDIPVGGLILSAHNDLPHFHWKNFMRHNPLKGTRQKVEKECYKCGTVFTVLKKRVKFHKGPRWYCSKICCYSDRYGESNSNFGRKHPGLNSGQKRPSLAGQNNPMFNKSRDYYYSEIGYREDLGHKVKSTWEANYARILKAKGIAYQYEPTSFTLESATYTPDFYLIGENRYVEVKGYCTEVFLNKLAEMKARYPKVKIDVIDEKQYLQLESKWAHRIPNWEITGSSSRRGSEIKFVWDTVVEKTQPSVKLTRCYDLTVEEDASYILNNLVCHNTSKMAAQPYLEPNVKKYLPMFQAELRDAIGSTIGGRGG